MGIPTGFHRSAQGCEERATLGNRVEMRFSLTPGSSPVQKGKDDESRFNGFPQHVKGAEAVPNSDISDLTWNTDRPERRHDVGFGPSRCKSRLQTGAPVSRV